MISNFVGLHVFISKFATTASHFFRFADFCLFINSLVLSLKGAKAFLWKSCGLLRAQVKKPLLGVLSLEITFQSELQCSLGFVPMQLTR